MSKQCRQEVLAQLAVRSGAAEPFQIRGLPGESNLMERARRDPTLSAFFIRPERILPRQTSQMVLAERTGNARPTFQPPHCVLNRAVQHINPPPSARGSEVLRESRHPKLPRHEGEPHVMPGRWAKTNAGPDEENTTLANANPSDKNAMKGLSGFQSARSKYAIDMRSKGHSAPFPPAAPTSGGSRPYAAAGLRRASGAPPTAASAGGKFIPPFVKKALQAQQGGGCQGKTGPGGGEDGEGPLSARAMQLLRLEPGAPLPDDLAKLDPHLIEQICNEVIDDGGEITWDDIAGQDVAKKLIQEVVVWPMLNPHIFKGARAPPKGILLFGPPGTGKTLLGKAIASNIRASFFSISASSLTSKWIGEGEKLVRTLFAVAGWLAPSVIFIDEIDSLLSARKSEGEHEASRRLKTEMLVQLEGCDPSAADRRVLLIGATNRPEELDEAARRRMPKQLYIPLPCAAARRQMILRQLGPGGSVAAVLSAADVDKIVEKTKGYSGSDMKNLIQEACQGPVRDAVRAMSGGGAGVAAIQETDLREVLLRDFAVAARAQRASVEPGEVLRYEVYNERHGAKIVDDGAFDQGTGAEGDDDGW